MTHRPVCVKCKREMKPERNGIILMDVDVDGTDQEAWHADLWCCPVCGTEIVTGFGCNPVAHEWDGMIPRVKGQAIAAGEYYECRRET